MSVCFSFTNDENGFVFFNGHNLRVTKAPQSLIDFVKANPTCADNLSSISCSPTSDDWIICWNGPNLQGRPFACSIKSGVYPKLHAELQQAGNPVTVCTLGPPPYFFLRRTTSWTADVPDNTIPYLRLLETLTLSQQIHNVIIGPDSKLIVLFANGFFLWLIEETANNSILLEQLQQNWREGNWLEAAALAVDPDAMAGSLRFFLRWGHDISFNVADECAQDIVQLARGAPMSNLQSFLIGRLFGNLMARNAAFRSGHMRRLMMEAQQEHHNHAINVGGMVDMSNLQQAGQLETMIHQWTSRETPKARQGSGNLFRWLAQ